MTGREVDQLGSRAGPDHGGGLTLGAGPREDHARLKREEHGDQTEVNHAREPKGPQDQDPDPGTTGTGSARGRASQGGAGIVQQMVSIRWSTINLWNTRAAGQAIGASSIAVQIKVSHRPREQTDPAQRVEPQRAGSGWSGDQSMPRKG